VGISKTQQFTTSTGKLGHAHAHVAFSLDISPCAEVQKPCQVLPHARARVRKVRLFDRAYTLRAIGSNPGEAETKL